MTSRSAGTAQISLWTALLTSAHQAAAASFAAAKSAERRLGHHQVALGIADQVLRDPLRFRVVRLAEIGLEPVMRREPQVLRRGHHHVGDHAAFQARHPVGQHLARHPAQHLQALRQHRQRRLRALISSEPHEPDPAPGQHRAEHVQPALGCPSRSPGTHPATTPPDGGPGDDPAATTASAPRPGGGNSAATRYIPPPAPPAAAASPRSGADGLSHPLRDQRGHDIVVMLPRRPRRSAAAGLMPGDHPPDGLRGRAADRGGPPVSSCLTVGGNDVHPFPRRLQ